MLSLVENDGGEIDWGSGVKNPRAMPAFSNYPRRKPIGIKANGECVFQFGLIKGVAEYEEVGKDWEKQINDTLEVELGKKRGGAGEPSLESNLWLPHADEILSILKSLFVTN